MWIRPNNQSNNQYLLENFTVADMNENKWQHGEVTFNSVFSNYAVRSTFIEKFC